MTRTPFRIEIVGSHEVQVYTVPSELDGMLSYLLQNEFAANKKTNCIAIEANWRDVLKTLIDYPGDLSFLS